MAKVCILGAGSWGIALSVLLHSNQHQISMWEFDHKDMVNLLDKRVLGTIHVAFGENKFQIYPHGSVWSPVHSDMVLLRPSCWVDDIQLLDKGIPVV